MNMKQISIIGVPSDYGQRRRGVDMGPSAIRYSGVIERLQALNFNVKDECLIGKIKVSHEGLEPSTL